MPDHTTNDILFGEVGFPFSAESAKDELYQRSYIVLDDDEKELLRPTVQDASQQAQIEQPSQNIAQAIEPATIQVEEQALPLEWNQPVASLFAPMPDHTNNDSLEDFDLRFNLSSGTNLTSCFEEICPELMATQDASQQAQIEQPSQNIAQAAIEPMNIQVEQPLQSDQPLAFLYVDQGQFIAQDNSSPRQALKRPLDSSNDEEALKKKKREENRIASRKCREKKKNTIKDLQEVTKAQQEEIDSLRIENEAVKASLEEQKQQNADLQAKIRMLSSGHLQNTLNNADCKIELKGLVKISRTGSEKFVIEIDGNN